MLCVTINNGFYPLQIRSPFPLCFTLRMADVITDHRFFTTNITYIAHIIHSMAYYSKYGDSII